MESHHQRSVSIKRILNNQLGVHGTNTMIESTSAKDVYKSRFE